MSRMEDKKMRRREFYEYGASQPRYEEIDGVKVYDNEWDTSLLEDEDGDVLNARCA